MTTNLHAHVEHYSRDCDGPVSGSYVVTLSDEEIAEHVKADGVNDFHDLHFKERVLGGIVSFHAEAEVRIHAEGFSYSEPTDEGVRNVEVEWCEDDCDLSERSYRDYYAEAAGY